MINLNRKQKQLYMTSIIDNFIHELRKRFKIRMTKIIHELHKIKYTSKNATTCRELTKYIESIMRYFQSINVNNLQN